MFYELINGLTPEQMQQLKALGVPHTRVSEWRHKKGLPSRKAVAALATVTGVDAMEIEREVMYLEMKPDERSLFQKILKVPAAALMGTFLVLQLASQPENANAANNLAHQKQASRIYIVASVMLAFRGLIETLRRPFGSRLCVSHR